MGAEHSRSQVPLKIPASVLGLNRGDEDRSFHFITVFSKDKGDPIIAKTPTQDPSAHYYNYRKLSHSPQAPSVIFPCMTESLYSWSR